MIIRKVGINDYDQIWEIFSKVIQGADTLSYDPKTPKSKLKKLWMADDMHTYVAEEDGILLGSYFIRNNHIDLGNHVANCGYMVDPVHRGKGIAKKMCEHSLQIAAQLKYKAMQFNLVVSTNESAIGLWKKCGFKTIGTTPKGYRHGTLGYVDAHIMYREL